MNGDSTSTAPAGLSLKSAALVAGFGLLVMVFAAPVANFYFMSQSVVSNDIAQTIENLRTHGTPYLIGVLLLFVTYVMDIFVAWALYWFLRPGQAALSQLIAWARIIYTGLAFVGLWTSLRAYDLATSPSASEQLTDLALQAQVFSALAASNSMELMALALFGLHLIIMSVALWRAPHTPSWLAVPVALAGLSYVVIFLGRYLTPDMNLDGLLLLALGELVLMGWLLTLGWRARTSQKAPS